MTNAIKDCLCKNYLAATDMFSDVVRRCPDELWEQDKRIILPNRIW